MSIVRPDLAALPGYSAGGLQPGHIRLASNELPFQPLPSVRGAVAAGDGVERYPDFLSLELRDALAAKFRVTREEVSVGNGSSALCYDLARLSCLPGDVVVGPWRSFEAYPILAGVAGAGWQPVPLTADDRLDLPALAEAASGQAQLMFLCNPNNPTGTAFDGDQLATFLDAVPSDTLVVVDEAYIEFAGPTVADAVDLYRARRPENLAVLRTFSKAYALAGLRVGYCIAHPRIISALLAVQVPFAVGAVAQRAASAALADEDEVLRRCAEVARRREALTAALRALAYPVAASHANFVWLPLGDHTAAFVNRCADDGIATRGFHGEGVRVTVGTEDECDAFLRSAATYSSRLDPSRNGMNSATPWSPISARSGLQ